MLSRFYSSLIFILVALTATSSFSVSMAQEPAVADTIQPLQGAKSTAITAVADTTVHIHADSIPKTKRGLEDIVTATANDSTIYSIDGKKVYLYKEAKVLYQDLSLEAGYIAIDYSTKQMYACGIPDSTGTKTVERPKFKEGNESYEMEAINYNFESKKAKVYNVITKQGEGYLHSELAKMMPDKSINIADGKYTTCDHEHPHFYLKMSKAKAIPEPHQQIVFGPSYMVIEDVPLPILGLPFGFFPQTSERSGGLLFPRFGEDNSRGFSVEGLGWYFVFGDYADLALTTDFFSLGTWAIHANSRYLKRYKFSGNLAIDYSNLVLGDKGSLDYSESKTFSIRWSHNQAQQASPSSHFSASVSFSSMNNNRYYGQSLDERLSASANSSIAYGKNWENTPLSLTLNLSHNQNMTDSTYTLGIPSVSFDVGKFAPFQRKNRVGKPKLYENFSMTYGMQFSNSISFKSSEWGTPDFYSKFKNGMKHTFGISLPTLSLLKHITVSPSISYGQTWFFQSTQYRENATATALDTIKSPSFSEFNITQTYSYGISASTRLYGLVQFKGDPIIKAIRHMMTPSIGISYSPNQKTNANGWRTYVDPKTGKEVSYNIFDGQQYSSPGGVRTAGMSFGLNNSLELKLRNRKDTLAGNIKLKLLESFGFNASYNFLADSMKLSRPISFNGRSNFFDKFGFNFNFAINPYNISPEGKDINQLYWDAKRGLHLGRLTSFNLSFDYSISGGKGKGVDQAIANEGLNHDVTGHSGEPYSPAYTLYYVDFEVPWSVSMGFSYSMTKQYDNYDSYTKVRTTTTRKSATATFRGDVSLTKNWKVGFQSGYDFRMATITTSSLNLYRDLHCFEFNFSWIPFGKWQSWSFGINVKSSTLRDLKYDKRNSFYDNMSY